MKNRNSTWPNEMRKKKGRGKLGVWQVVEDNPWISTLNPMLMFDTLLLVS